MYPPDCILALHSCYALPPVGRLWPSEDNDEEEEEKEKEEKDKDDEEVNGDDDHPALPKVLMMRGRRRRIF